MGNHVAICQSELLWAVVLCFISIMYLGDTRYVTWGLIWFTRGCSLSELRDSKCCALGVLYYHVRIEGSIRPSV